MTQNVAMRERLFTMRMSEEEWQRADRLAQHFGLNLAGVIRMLLKEKARELALDPPGLGGTLAAIDGDPAARVYLERHEAQKKTAKKKKTK